MYHVPGARYDTATAVRSTWYTIPPVPGTRIFIRTSTVFYFGKTSVSPARSVILIHGSASCMHEEQPTKSAHVRTRRCLKGWCCYCRRYYCCCYHCCPLCHCCCCADTDTVDNVRRDAVSVYSPGVRMLYTFSFPS